MWLQEARECPQIFCKEGILYPLQGALLKEGLFFLSSSASSPPPTPLPLLLDSTYLMGGRERGQGY